MKKNTFKVTILAIILLLVFSIVSYAATDTYSMKMTTSSTQVKAGETLTISLKLDNINIQTGDKGLAAYEANIEYDTNIFEDLKMTSATNWDAITVNNNKFASVKSDGIAINQTQEIATITLKVKSNATLGDTVIKIKNILASNGENDISTADATLTIKVSAATSNGDNNNNTNNDDNSGTNNSGTNNSGTNNSGTNNSGTNNSGTNNSGTNNSGTNNSGTNNSGTNNSGTNNSGTNNSGTSNKGNDNTSSTDKKLPQTGEFDYIIVIGAILLILVGVVAVIKYKKYKGI